MQVQLKEWKSKLMRGYENLKRNGWRVGADYDLALHFDKPDAPEKSTDLSTRGSQTAPLIDVLLVIGAISAVTTILGILRRLF